MGTNARPADERLLLFWDSYRGGMKLWADDAVLAKRREINKRDAGPPPIGGTALRDFAAQSGPGSTR
jgi:hypothetical protein